MEKQEIKVIDLINDAFNIYKLQRGIKESSIKQYQKDIRNFIKYVNEHNLTNNRSALTQESINNYHKYLQDNKIGVENINKRCELITRLINEILCVHNNYQHYKFKEVRYTKLKDKRPKNKKGSNFPLNSVEVKAINECQNLTQKEQEYQVIFLLQIETGLRVSDMHKLLNAEYGQENEYFILSTTKNNTPAYIRHTETLTDLLEKTKYFKVIKDGDFNNATYNRHIKNICRKAQLDRTYEWIDSKGNKHNDKICELMTSHNARHTFIQNMRNMGLKDEVIALLTGHTDDQVLRKNYNKPSHQDNIKKLNSVLHQISTEAIKKSEIAFQQVNAVEELFALKEITALREMYECGINIFDLQQIQTVYNKLEDTSLLSEAVTQFKNHPTKIDNWVYDFIWKLCKAHYNTKAYSLFQYKLYQLGLSQQKPIPEEIVGQWWADEDYANQEALSDLPPELWDEHIT